VTNESQSKQAIMVEVRQAIRNIETASRASRRRRRARRAEKNLDAQRKRFDNA